MGLKFFACLFSPGLQGPLLAELGAGPWSRKLINLWNHLLLNHPDQETLEGGGPLNTCPPVPGLGGNRFRSPEGNTQR